MAVCHNIHDFPDLKLLFFFNYFGGYTMYTFFFRHTHVMKNSSRISVTSHLVGTCFLASGIPPPGLNGAFFCLPFRTTCECLEHTKVKSRSCAHGAYKVWEKIGIMWVYYCFTHNHYRIIMAFLIQIPCCICPCFERGASSQSRSHSVSFLVGATFH